MFARREGGTGWVKFVNVCLFPRACGCMCEWVRDVSFGRNVLERA